MKRSVNFSKLKTNYYYFGLWAFSKLCVWLTLHLKFWLCNLACGYCAKSFEYLQPQSRVKSSWVVCYCCGCFCVDWALEPVPWTNTNTTLQPTQQARLLELPGSHSKQIPQPTLTTHKSHTQQQQKLPAYSWLDIFTVSVRHSTSSQFGQSVILWWGKSWGQNTEGRSKMIHTDSSLDSYIRSGLSLPFCTVHSCCVERVRQGPTTIRVIAECP